MKQIIKIMSTVNLGYCPTCRNGGSYLRSTPRIAEPGDEPKFCEHCGTSSHVQRKVDICPFCHEPVLRWTGHLSSPCDVYDSQDAVVIHDHHNYERIEFAHDPSGDLWMIPYEMDYELCKSWKPVPATIHSMRTALDVATNTLGRRIKKMWDSAYRLGLDALGDDANQ